MNAAHFILRCHTESEQAGKTYKSGVRQIRANGHIMWQRTDIATLISPPYCGIDHSSNHVACRAIPPVSDPGTTLVLCFFPVGDDPIESLYHELDHTDHGGSV